MRAPPLLGFCSVGLESLLRDDKKEELSRLFTLYCKLPTGLLEPDADRFGTV